MTIRKNISQQEMLEFIKDYKKEHLIAPLQSHIADKFGVSRQAVQYHFNLLRDELKKYPEYKRYFDNKSEAK